MPALRLPVISCSLDVSSRSRLLARRAVELLHEAGHHPDLLDLAELGLPPFDNGSVFDHPAYRALHRAIADADGVVLAFPIYNWAPSSTVRSLVEATGTTGDGEHESAWFDKVVTFVAAAGLPQSYLATGPLAQSLMADFKCVINPYTAYVSDRDWRSGALSTGRVARLEKTLAVHAELASLLSRRSYTSGWEV